MTASNISFYMPDSGNLQVTPNQKDLVRKVNWRKTGNITVCSECGCVMQNILYSDW